MQDVLNSLAPLLAFPTVFTALALLGGAGRSAVTELLSVVVVLLAQLVLSETLARRWRREASWPRYAVAFNWCQWLTPIIFIVALLVTASPGPAMIAASVYMAVLQWFLARHGLDLSRLRALAFVLLTSVGSAALLEGPQLLSRAMQAAP